MKLILLLVACCGTALQTTSACADGDLEKLVDETYRRLTDEERVAQIKASTSYTGAIQTAEHTVCPRRVRADPGASRASFWKGRA